MHAKLMRVTRVLAAASLLSGAAAVVGAQQPDNTKVNKRDRNAGAATADKAKDNKSDREMMQEVRKAIVDDKDLSTYAHNVKVIGKNGKITLKGPVRSSEEKTSVVAKATEVAGAGNVVDQLTVKPEKTSGKADRSVNK
jgi:hyperosmotically inducible periplasmic protein